MILSEMEEIFPSKHKFAQMFDHYINCELHPSVCDMCNMIQDLSEQVKTVYTKIMEEIAK